MAAADAGKHILIEKPLAMTAAEGQEVVEHCKEKGVLIAAGFMMRFGACIQAMKKAIAEGKIGKPVSAYAQFTCWYPDIPGAWRQKKTQGGGGALVDMGNCMCADEAPEKAVGVMAPLAFHVHAKDFLYKPCTARNPGKGWFGTRGGAFLRGTVIGHGVVPVEACLRILKNAGYDGTVAIEFEGMEPCEEAIALSRENLAALMQL